MDPSVLAKGFKYAIFGDFSKKHKGGPLWSKKSVKNREKFFPEIIEERILDLFLSGSAGGNAFFLEVAQASPPLSILQNISLLRQISDFSKSIFDLRYRL